MNKFKYSNNNKRYHTLDYFYKQKFGQKVVKININGGFTCPNIDGKVGTKGCIYCSKTGSGEFAGNPKEDIRTQLKKGKEKIKRKCKYIAYFGVRTNTYAPLEILKEKYETALKEKDIVGISIATRPDAITDDILDYLETLNKKTFLTIELGLQTIHEKTTKIINRCHDLKCFDDMVKKLKQRNIFTVAHIINGLPYETKEMMIETVKHLNKINIDGIKIHMLNILKNTELEKLYKIHPFKILNEKEYIDIVCTQLEYLKPEIVIQRLTGDPDKNDIIQPQNFSIKIQLLNNIDKELNKRKIYQGIKSK